jgi:hypothetical protein
MADVTSRSALQALSLDAESAGAAMACRYLSSDEYEAELIADRRRAGAYGSAKRYGFALWGAVAAAMLLLIGIAI